MFSISFKLTASIALMRPVKITVLGVTVVLMETYKLVSIRRCQTELDLWFGGKTFATGLTRATIRIP